MSHFTYPKYRRNGESIMAHGDSFKRIPVPGTEKNRRPKMMAVSRVRTGKTAKDHNSGAHQRRIQNRLARDAWRADTRAAVYADQSLVPAFPG